LSLGRPGPKVGTPSPFKKYWVIRILGGLVRIEGAGISQFERGPTPFPDLKIAKKYASRVVVGEPHVAELLGVKRAWLESVARGEHPGLKVEVYRLSRLVD